MTKEIQELIYETVYKCECGYLSKRLINNIYNNIWIDIIIDYKVNSEAKKLWCISIEKYIANYSNITKDEFNILKNMLIDDGFMYYHTNEGELILTIDANNIIKHANNLIIESNKEEIVTKRIIAPFAETRRRK